MNTQQEINRIVETDVSLQTTGRFTVIHKAKDWNHLRRRQQQRAISDAMIQIALIYGSKRFDRGALVYTLGDRTLRFSPYARFTDVLRGLTVVCQNGSPNPQVLTAYWHYATRRRVRK